MSNHVRSILALALTGPAIGCGGAAAPPAVAPATRVVAEPTATTPVGAKGHQLVEALVQGRSEPALRKLMAINGVEPPATFEMRGFLTWGSGTADATGVVADPSRIKSLGKTYIAVMLTVIIDGQKLGRALLLDEDGKLLKDLGAREHTKEAEASAFILSLGAPDAWFVEVERPESKPPFTRITDFHLVSPAFTRLIRVRHRSGIAFSLPPAMSKDGRSDFSFGDPDDVLKGLELGRDARGTEVDAALVWDPKEHLFKGPSTIRSGDKLVYEVVLDESHGFQPSDR